MVEPKDLSWAAEKAEQLAVSRAGRLVGASVVLTAEMMVVHWAERSAALKAASSVALLVVLTAVRSVVSTAGNWEQH